MAYKNPGLTLPMTAASAIGAHLPVFMNIASSRDEVVVLAVANTSDVIGMTQATVASAGYEVGVVVSGVAKAIAAASLGAGVRVAVASTNGALGPLQPSGIATALGSALGAAGARFVVGRSLTAAAAGDIFSILLDPCEII